MNWALSVTEVVLPCRPGVLLISGCCNETPQMEWFINHRHLFLTSLEAGCLRSLREQIRRPVRAHFLVHTWRLLLCPHLGKGRRGSLGSLIRTLIPSRGPHLLASSHPPPPKSPAPDTITLGVRFNTRVLGVGGGHGHPDHSSWRTSGERDSTSEID